jgi:hypothetical protein
MSPQASRAPPYDRTIIQIPQEHKNVAFEYLQNDKVSVDGADKPNEASVVEAGKWRIFEITANGGFIITDKEINGVLICPIVVFVDKSKHGIVCPGVASFTNLEEPNRGATYTETSRFPLKDPEPDDRCGKVGPL